MQTDSPLVRLLRTAPPPLALVLAVAAAYSNSLDGEFIFDDNQSIPQNESIRSLWPLSGYCSTIRGAAPSIPARW